MKALIKRILYAGLPVPVIIRPVIRVLYHTGVCGVEGLAFFKKVFWIEPVMRSVCQEIGSGLRAERLPYMRGKGALFLGEKVNLSGLVGFTFMSGMPVQPEIRIGSGTFIGHGCGFSVARRIVIGKGCLIAGSVHVHDNDGHPLSPDRRLRNERIRQDEAAEVIIGDNVWIGGHSLVLKGVTIGDGAIVGAGSVVTRDVPSASVVAGNPARVIKTLR